MRGRDDHGHFAPEPAPVGEFTESNIQARREVLYVYPNNVYFGVIPDIDQPSFPDRPVARIQDVLTLRPFETPLVAPVED